jgi:hypothetical protein
LGKHDGRSTDKGHDPAKQQGGDKSGIEKYRREDEQGWAAGREGKPDNYSR